VIEIAAVLLPAAAGLKSAAIVQLLPGAILAEQLLVSLKLLALIPVRAIPRISNALLPVLESVTL
jgi:hypothetical protein